jgi:hypothetical protein
MMETHIWTFINKTADVIVDLWQVEPRITQVFSDGPFEFETTRFNCNIYNMVFRDNRLNNRTGKVRLF